MFGFALDDMHMVGGGAVQEGLDALFGMDSKYKTQHEAVGNTIVNLVDAYFEAWDKPREFVRQCGSLKKKNEWKMRMGHNAVMYHMIGILAIEEIRRRVDRASPRVSVSDLFMCFVIAMRLIGMTTHQAPSPSDITFARECLNSYVKGYTRVFGIHFLTAKNHLLIHLADEAEFYQSHLGGFNAYPFENFMNGIRRRMVKTPKKPLAQVYNHLTKAAFHADEGENSLGEVGARIKEDALLQAVKRHGSLHLPSWTVESCNVGPNGKGRQFVQCRGFEISLS